MIDRTSESPAWLPQRVQESQQQQIEPCCLLRCRIGRRIAELCLVLADPCWFQTRSRRMPRRRPPERVAMEGWRTALQPKCHIWLRILLHVICRRLLGSTCDSLFRSLAQLGDLWCYFILNVFVPSHYIICSGCANRISRAGEEGREMTCCRSTLFFSSCFWSLFGSFFFILCTSSARSFSLRLSTFRCV